MKAKKLFALLLVFAMLAGTIPVFAANNGYTDVPLNHWGYDVISKWSSKYSILVGNGAGKFYPDSHITLADLVTILSRTFGYVERDTSVSVSPEWAVQPVQNAVAAGIIPKAEMIDASVKLTREEVINLIALAYGISPSEGDPSFLDKSDITEAYKGYVKAFQDRGYVLGSDANPLKSMLRPGSFCTRTEVLKIMDNMVSDIVESDVNGQTYEKSLVVRKGANLANTTIKGDLIIAQGVGDGHVELDSVIIEGKLIAYGGGENTIIIKGNSMVPSVIAVKAYGEPVRIMVQDGATVTTVVIAPFSSAVVNGNISELVVDGDAKVTLQDADVDNITITDGGANVVVGSGSTVENMNVDGASTIKVDEGGKVNSAKVTAGDVAIVGRGTLTNVYVSEGTDAGVRIDTSNTTVQNKSSYAVTNSNGISVAPGESKTVAPTPPPVSNPEPDPSPSNPTPPPPPVTETTVTSSTALLEALSSSSIVNITVTGNITVDGDLIVPYSKTLIIETGATLTVNGTLWGHPSTQLVIKGTGQVNATGISNLGEGTYKSYDFYWMKMGLFSHTVLDQIKSSFSGSGNFDIVPFITTGSNPNVFEVIRYYKLDNITNDPITITLTNDCTIPDGKDFEIDGLITLIIPDGKTLTIDGELKGYSSNISIIVEGSGKIDLAEPNADLTQGTYIQVNGQWTAIGYVTDEASLLAAVNDVQINTIYLSGNVTVDGDLTLRNGTALTVKSGSSLTVNGQLKTLTLTGYSAKLIVESGSSFNAVGLTDLPADTYSGHGDYWRSETWINAILAEWRSILQNKFGLAQIDSYAWSYKNPPAGIYLQDEFSVFIMEDLNVVLNSNCTIPEDAGLKLRNTTLTIPDGVTLTVGNDGIMGEFDSKIILQGSGCISGATTLSGAGTYVYTNNQWVAEIPVDVSNAEELISTLSSTTQDGLVIHVTQDIADIGEDITIPVGVILVINPDVSVSTTRNIMSIGGIHILGTLTISGGTLSGSKIMVGESGTLTHSGTGTYATNTNVYVKSGGRLGIISPPSKWYLWNGSEWI